MCEGKMTRTAVILVGMPGSRGAGDLSLDALDAFQGMRLFWYSRNHNTLRLIEKLNTRENECEVKMTRTTVARTALEIFACSTPRISRSGAF